MGLAAQIYDATWGRGFAAIYDRGLKATEEAGLREMRRQTLAKASGRTLDIGAGTGVNVDLFPAAVSELVLVEPDPHMIKRLRAKLEGRGEGPARSRRLPNACRLPTTASTPLRSPWFSVPSPIQARP